MKSLTKRERLVLRVIAALHQEFGLASDFTAEAIGHVADSPCTGSLAGLTLHGLISQRSCGDGIVYAMMDAGWLEVAAMRAGAS